MKQLKKNLLLLFFILLNVTALFSQEELKEIINKNAIQEKVWLFTDRTTYISGEHLWFHAVCQLSKQNEKLSTLLYLELLDKKGNPVNQKKFELQQRSINGTIELPDDIVSGQYYIRAYTAYMKNFDRSIIPTNEITIINPDLSPKEPLVTVVPDSIKIKQSKELSILSTSSVFPVNSNVQLELQAAALKNATVSIVKKGSYHPYAVAVNQYLQPIAKADTIKKVTYPDIRSVSISGEIIDKVSGLPVKNCIVYATTIDNTKQLHITRTNKQGRFVFSFSNMKENHTLYIAPQKSDQQLNVLIDADFIQGLPKFTFQNKTVDSSMRNLIDEMYINYQITNMYKDALYPNRKAIDTIPKTFQNTMITTYFKDYVLLDSLAEQFNEIVPYTKARRKATSTTIQVVDKNTHNIFTAPLVMLDHIPFNDYNKLLSISPNKITSVSVLAEPFILGSETILGIVDVETKNKEMAGLSLPEDVVRVDYITLESSATVNFSNVSETITEKPGFRNTLYWNPTVNFNNEKASIEFFTGTGHLAYDVIVSGINNKGELVNYTKTITIGDLK